jgi:hypothetical protein
VGEITVGDPVTVGAGDAEQGGRVTARVKDKVEVEMTDRPGFRFWFSVADVRVGAARPSPTMMAMRWMAAKKKTEEVRPVCKHLNLARVCPDCALEDGEKR